MKFYAACQKKTETYIHTHTHTQTQKKREKFITNEIWSTIL